MLGLTPFNRNQLQKQGSTDLMDFYNMFDDFFDKDFMNLRSLKNDTFKMDVKETDQQFLIEAELEDGILKIQIPKSEPKADRIQIEVK